MENSQRPATASAPTAHQHRQRIWDELRAVARPDSRFHWDFSAFIADFDGSDICAERVAQLDAYRQSKLLFITPDNSTEHLRRRAYADGKQVLVTTYGIRRGFLLIDGPAVAAADRSYAATLDGLDRLARPVSLTELERHTGGQPIGLLVTGGSAVSRNGTRFGKGHGYFDLEWAMLSEIGLTSPASVVVDVVHDCQYVDEVLEGEPHDVAVDFVVTPTRTIPVTAPGREHGWVRWDMLVGTEHEFLPPIEELRQRREPGR